MFSAPKKAEIKRSRSRSHDGGSSSEAATRARKPDGEKRLKWIIPNIVVRVVSKKVANGKLYNCKLRISDVLSAHKFLAVPLEQDSSSLIVYDSLTEKDLETVIPKQDNSQVAVLRGEFRGEIGKILSRDRKKDEVVIQVGLTDIIKVSQDHCCQVAT